MSKTKSVSAFIAGCAALALSCWYITGALPLNAEPQQIMDGAGISVDVGGAHLMHRTSVAYPRAAYLKGVQGMVTAQVKIDSSGEVVDAAITAGPDELRKTVIQSLLNWHFASDSANSTRQVNIAFTMPEGAQAPATQAPAAIQEDQIKILQDYAHDSPAFAARAAEAAKPIKDILVRGLPDAARDELLSKLPVHVGDSLTLGAHAELVKAVNSFDQHLTVATLVNKDGEMAIEIRAPGASGGPIASTAGPGRFGNPNWAGLQPQSITATVNVVKISPQAAAANAISQVPPVYPPLAQAARVQGDIQFDAIIGKDGKVQNLHLLSGPPLLVAAAMAAVQDWTYKPTIVNGQPVAVSTTIDVNFTLP